MRTTSLLSAVLLLAMLASTTSAQLLDGQWFRVTSSSDGLGLDLETEQAVKGKVKSPVHYARFSVDEGGGLGANYAASVFAPTESGGWMYFSNSEVHMLDAEETVAFASVMALSATPLPDQEGGISPVIIQFNGQVKTKLKGEELKSAKITALGTTTQFSSDAYILVGRSRLKLTRVPESKVPAALLVESAASAETPRAPVVDLATVKAAAATPATN